jgi:hypothetical protein
MLRIGYYAAYLILAVRALEERGDAMSPKTFLSNLPIESPASTGHESIDSKATRNNTQMLQVHTSRYAHSVLETFVEMPPFLMDSIPTYLCLVIGYSALLLAHYDETQSKVSASVSLGLISRLEDWCIRTPSKSWAIKFANLARQKVESRTGTTRSRRNERKTDREGRQAPGWESTSIPMPGFQSGTDTSPTALSEARPYNAEDFVAGADAFPLPTDGIHAGYELSQPVMPSMEDFFGGGFLDFSKPILLRLLPLPPVSADVECLLGCSSGSRIISCVLS